MFSVFFKVLISFLSKPNLFILRRNLVVEELHEKTYKDLPGFFHVTADDLRVEAIKLEDSVKKYLTHKECKFDERQEFYQLIKKLKRFPKVEKYSEDWNKFVSEVDNLRVIRNKIIHGSYSQLKDPSAYYSRFRQANDTLRIFKINSANREKFKVTNFSNGQLDILIDGNNYTLEISDIKNLLVSLDSHGKQGVTFIKGKVIESKIADYEGNKITFYIEGFKEFTLTHEESYTLSDMLHSHLGRYIYR